ncbi:MAG: site-specific integrase [Defluviitaleaceae bacterium]|nr:site-specific integrase [Defluviitaleaceae bacterium]
MKKSKQNDVQSILTSPEIQAIIAETVKKSVAEAITATPSDNDGAAPRPRKRKGRGQGEGSVYQRKDGLWSARVTVGYDQYTGKQIRKAVYADTKREVIDKLMEMQTEINKGTFVDPTNVTVGEWLPVWLEDYRKNKIKHTTYNKERILIKRIIPTLGQIKLKDLKPLTVQRFINSLAEDLETSTLKVILIMFNQAINQAVDNGIIPKNPIKGKIKLAKKSYKERRVLTVDEQKIFIETAKELHEMGYAGMDVFIFLLGTGLRIGECLALTWDDIDFENAILNVNKTFSHITGVDSGKYEHYLRETKTRASNRKIPLLPQMLDVLEQRKQNNSYLSNIIFQNVKGGYQIQAHVWKRMKIIERITGIEDITPHALRHTFATRGLENGIPLKVMSELLGHSSIQMTADLYTHVLPETKEREMEKLSNLFD